MLFSKRLWAILGGVFGFLFAVLIIGTYFANSYETAVNNVFGTSSSKIIDENENNEDTDYYKSSFLDSNGEFDGDALDAWQKALCEEIQGEGTVLVYNDDNGLPVPTSSTSQVGVTCFGRGSADTIYSGTGSGQVDAATAATFQSALTEAGYNVNTGMIDWYTSQIAGLEHDRATAGMFDDGDNIPNLTWISEIPVSNIQSAVSSGAISYNNYKDMAVVVFGRSGGEGADLPTGKFNDGTGYFELQEVERELLKYVCSQGFGKVVVAINSSNALAMDWLVDQSWLTSETSGKGVDACLWIGGPGQYGLNAVAKIISGDINPSGKFVDTFATSSLSSAAIQNFGSYTYANVSAVGNAAVFNEGESDETEIDGAPGDATANRYAMHYMVEEEGIYVGYKYYETRYEDCVLNQGNANGSAGTYNSSDSNKWSYSDEVAYAFGYGLSYTSFTQEIVKDSEGTALTADDPAFTYDADTDTYTAYVKVTNASEENGGVAGKDIVEVYAQKPYTEYDKATGLEKASVELVGFAKTGTIQPGNSEVVKVSVEGTTLASYDRSGAKTYILEDGDYYLAVGTDAHDALNNILASKGKSTTDGMDAEGNASMAYKFSINEVNTSVKFDTSISYTNTSSVATTATVDATTYASDSVTGTAVTNQFDDVDLNYFGNFFTYLTRNDWQNTWPKSMDSLTANSAMIQAMQFNYTPDTSKSDIVTESTETNYTVVTMRGKDFDDPLWDDLLNQLSLNDMAEIVGHAGYGTQAIPSVALPATIQQDGPQGINGTYSGGDSSIAYTSEPIMAATWNVEILYKIGLSMGEDALRMANRVSGWYGPAMNIHRTPYCGRNFEYYSEDGFMNGIMAAAEVTASESMGLCSYIKHFALNDQETWRQSVCTFANEQAMREIYLKPFQYAVQKGGATALMTSFNRIGCRWAGATKGLLTNVLRDEWGFVGVTLTDAVMQNRNWMNLQIGTEAGNNTWLTMGDFLVSDVESIAKSDSKFLANIRESCHCFLYAYCNSTAVNGMSSTAYVVHVRPGWQKGLLAADWICGIVAVASFVMYVLSTYLPAANKKNTSGSSVAKKA